MDYSRMGHDFEDQFLGALFESGDAKTVKSLKEKIAACGQQGGAFDPKTEMCTVQNAWPLAINPYPYGFSYPFPTGWGGGGHRHHHHGGHHGLDGFEMAFLQGLAEMGALGAPAARKAAQIAAADTAKQCANRGGVWDAGRSACMPKRSASTTPATPAPAPIKTKLRDIRAECLASGGAWNANKQKCEVTVIEGKPVAATPTNLAMCKAQNGTWYSRSRQCVRPADITACTAQGGTVDGLGRCQTAAGAPTRPGRPAKPLTAKQQCGTDGGTWYPGARKCVLPADITACTATGGSIVRGQCKLPAPARPDRPARPGRPGRGGVGPIQPGGGDAGPLPMTTRPLPPRQQCAAQGGIWKRRQCQTVGGAPIALPPPTVLPPTIGQCPPGYVFNAAANNCSPLPAQDYGTYPPPGITTVPPGGAMVYPPGGSGGQWDIPGGGGGGGGGYGGGQVMDESSLVPPSETDAILTPQEGGAPTGQEMVGECAPGFSATLPQEYSDEWGKMTVLQVFCKQSAPAGLPADAAFTQGRDPFEPYADGSAPGVITGSMGPAQTFRPISSIEAEEMAAGANGGGLFGW